MDRFELYSRIHSNLGDIEWVPLMFGSPKGPREQGKMFSKQHQACLDRAQQRLEEEQIGKRLAVPDRTVLGDSITAQRISAIVAEHKAKAGAKRALIIVDYLQLIPIPEDVAEQGDLAADKFRVRLIQQVIERSRTAEDPLGDTALVITEARKPQKRNDDWGDSMSELMGSARLSYAADAVLMYREMSSKEMKEYYGTRDAAAAERRRAQLRERGIAPVTLILEKGRDGMIRGTWAAEFLFKKSRFVELAPGRTSASGIPTDNPADPDGKIADVVGGCVPPGGQLPLPPAGPCGDSHGKKSGSKSKGEATRVDRGQDASLAASSTSPGGISKRTKPVSNSKADANTGVREKLPTEKKPSKKSI